MMKNLLLIVDDDIVCNDIYKALNNSSIGVVKCFKNANEIDEKDDDNRKSFSVVIYSDDIEKLIEAAKICKEKGYTRPTIGIFKTKQSEINRLQQNLVMSKIFGCYVIENGHYDYSSMIDDIENNRVDFRKLPFVKEAEEIKICKEIYEKEKNDNATPVRTSKEENIAEVNEKRREDRAGFIRNITDRKSKAIVIGVISSEKGSGNTSLVHNIAKEMASTYSVLVLDKSTNKDLYIYTRTEEQEYDVNTLNLSQVNLKEYDYVIIDFEPLASFSGDNIHLSDSFSSEKLERQFCDYIFLTCSSREWKINIAKRYIDEAVFEQTTEHFIFVLDKANELCEAFYKKYKKKRSIVKRENVIELIERG